MNSKLSVLKKPKAHKKISIPICTWRNVVMHLVNNVQPNKHFQNPNLMLQLKDQGNFAVAILGQDRSRGLELPTEKETRRSGRGTINHFIEKMVLLSVFRLIIVSVPPFQISLVRILFPMQSNVIIYK